jgi:transposase
MENAITFVALDAHKVEDQAAMLLPGESKAVEWDCLNERTAVERMVKKVLRQAPGEVRFCYEAGPCGYALQRWIEGAGCECTVVAPSLTPRKPGERVKTNRRDARKLVELFRAGLLTEVSPPTQEDEAVRDLCRGREDARQDLMRSRHRLSKLLLRRGYSFSQGKRAWSYRHRLWLRSLHFEQEYDQVVFDDYLLAIEQLEARMRALEETIERVSRSERFAAAVGALRCFRGFDTISAMSIVAELHDFLRFRSPRALMAFVGLVPSESSSGQKHTRGEITKTGDSLVRRLLVEAAWHYRHRPNLAYLQSRREGQPARVIALADRAMQRLNRRFQRMLERGKPKPKIAVAIARELAGFVWAALYPQLA